MLYLAHFPTESHTVWLNSVDQENKKKKKSFKLPQSFWVDFAQSAFFFFLDYTTLSSSNYEMQARVMVAKLPLVGLFPPKNQ